MRQPGEHQEQVRRLGRDLIGILADDEKLLDESYTVPRPDCGLQVMATWKLNPWHGDREAGMRSVYEEIGELLGIGPPPPDFFGEREA